MARVLLGLLIFAVAEIYLLFRVGEALGLASTLGLLGAAAVVGYVAARAQGLGVLRRWREAIAVGAAPEEGLTDGFVVLLGGALLAAPGFLSDILGALLLVPPVRRRVTAALRQRVAAWMQSGAVKVGTVVDVGAGWEPAPASFDRSGAIDTEGHAVEDRPERLLAPPKSPPE